jgi:hypothetical protein
MHSRLLVAASIAGLFLAAPASAGQACCDRDHAKHQMAAGMPCCDMPCCDEALAMERTVDITRLLPLQDDPQLAAPARQVTDVWFKRPVMVGRHILQGHYVIEHDNDRMARGEPCTHIYAYDNQRVPVVRFHCTHLERGLAGANVAVLATLNDGSMQQLLEFQFLGETAAHGVPSDR